MKFTRDISYQQNGKNYVLTLDRFGNFVNLQEAPEGSFRAADHDELLRRFFSGEELKTQSAKTLREKFERSLLPLLAEGVAPGVVRDMLLMYEEAVLRLAPTECRSSGMMSTRSVPSYSAPWAPVVVPPATAPEGSGTSDSEIMSRFLDPESPCFFKQCEELRSDLAAAIKAAGGEGCSSCELGRIKTQFATRAVKMAQSSPES